MNKKELERVASGRFCDKGDQFHFWDEEKPVRIWIEPLVDKAPKIYCPKEKKKVPVWYCIGSFTQQRKSCEHWVGWVEVDVSRDYAQVTCNFNAVKE